MTQDAVRQGYVYREGYDNREVFGDYERKNPYPVLSARYRHWELGWFDADRALEELKP